MTNDEKKYLDDLITKALTVTTDEVEGQQVIDLDNLNLCAVDYATSDVDSDTDSSLTDMDILGQIYADDDFMKLIISDPSNIQEYLMDIDTSTRVIIEFSEATIKDPNPVTYSINIKPGDQITDETIIGYVMQDGEMKTVKSIFSKGTVMSVNDNTDYFRLYPSKCDRHYVLDNVLSGSGNDYDITSQLEELTNKFTNEGVLYALITNNLCQSLLPYVLSHRYRGVYTRKSYINSKWYLDSSDAAYDSLDISTYVKNKKFQNNKQYNTSLFIYDTVNENLPTGITIFDTSIMQELDDLQDTFGASIIGSDITKADMKSWKKRAKKKRKRKKVKKEIKEKTQNSVNKIKTSDSPYDAIQNESSRLLSARETYVDAILNLYKNKEKLPLCKYDPEYTDCKFLVNDSIDKHVLKNVNKYDKDFSYYAVGDVDNYYNYYFSLLGNINLISDNDYVNEYYQIITDIINKRLIVEGKDANELKLSFMKLFNDNVKKIFTIGSIKNNSETYINNEFNKFENLVNVYVQNKINEYDDSIKQKFTSLELGDDAIQNAGSLYSTDNQYQKVYDYISSIYTYDNDEDSDCPNEIVSQLATMYQYIKSYGDGSQNQYKDLELNDKYLYLGLVQEESKKITDFWDKIITLYESGTMNKCIEDLNELAHSFDQYATWPLPNEISIDNITYKHYLFENVYPKDTSSPIDISIGDYSFPDSVEFPEIPDSYPVDENWALNEMNNHEQQEPDDPNVITFLDFKYWQKYFALATLICLVPAYWNCGLDIMPFIQLIPLPCIFVAIASVNLPMFNLLIVFGIAIRGMYPWPIILYLNTSDQPISVLTPLVAILDQLKDTFYGKLEQIEQAPIQALVNLYIKKLNNEINDIKKENIKLQNFKTVIKGMKFPKAVSMQEQFAKLVDPSIDTRQRIQRVETLIRKNRV